MSAEIHIESRYRITRRLHVGGMAEVFLASQQGPVRRRVVIKRMLPELAARAEMRQRFSEEADLLARLAGPGLPALYEAGADEQGPFLVLQYIEGASLRELLDSGGPLAVGQAAALLGQALAIVERLHEAEDPAGAGPLGFVHRDLAPENLQLDRRGRLWLLDLGLAKSSASQVRTAAGIRQGRLCYMAPELLRGLPASAASDRFALALIGAELVGAFSPGDDLAPAALERLLSEGPLARLDWPPSVEGRFRRAIEGALAEAPEERTAAEALAAALAPLADASILVEPVAAAQPVGRPTPALPPSLPAGGERALARAPRPWTGKLLAAVLLALLGGLFYFRFHAEAWKRLPQEPPPVGGAHPGEAAGPAAGSLLWLEPPPGGPFELSLDGRPLGVVNARRRLPLAPGAHSLVLSDESSSRYYRKDLLVGEGGRRSLRFPLAAGGPPLAPFPDSGGPAR